jgi:hypothetical protein
MGFGFRASETVSAVAGRCCTGGPGRCSFLTTRVNFAARFFDCIAVVTAMLEAEAVRMCPRALAATGLGSGASDCTRRFEVDFDDTRLFAVVVVGLMSRYFFIVGLSGAVKLSEK